MDLILLLSSLNGAKKHSVCHDWPSLCTVNVADRSPNLDFMLITALKAGLKRNQNLEERWGVRLESLRIGEKQGMKK